MGRVERVTKSGRGEGTEVKCRSIPGMAQPPEQEQPARRMSRMELIFREAVCPATLPEDDPTAADEGATLADGLLLDGVDSLRRMRKSLSRQLSSTLVCSVTTDETVGLNDQPISSTTRKSVAPPPPPQMPSGEAVQQSLEAAASRRRSSLSASSSSIDSSTVEQAHV